MKLNWKSYGDRGLTADGDKGTWRIEEAGKWWWLTVQPPFTRGMLNQGKFVYRTRAQEFAQEREDGVEIVPLHIEATND